MSPKAHTPATDNQPLTNSPSHSQPHKTQCHHSLEPQAHKTNQPQTTKAT